MPRLFISDSQRNDDIDAMPPDYLEGLPEFFDTKNISDIQTFEYFQNSTNLAILSTISDLARWAHEHLLRDNGPEETINRLNFFTSRSIFFWINRQLVGYSKQIQERLVGQSLILIYLDQPTDIDTSARP